MELVFILGIDKGRQLLNNKGFSLLEILVGLVILAVGLLAVASMQITSMRGNFFSDNIMQASILGQDRLEELKAIPLNSTTAATTFSVQSHTDGFIAIRGTTFSRAYVVENHPDATLVDSQGIRSRVIRVIINWSGPSNHSVQFSTVKSP